MQSQTLKTTAIGAMLFGGTLGAASVANAGLTVTAADIYLDVNAAAQFKTSNLATAMAGGFAYDGDTGGSVTLSPFTSAGFTLTANSAGGAAIWSVYPSYFTFTADALTTVTLSGDTAADSAIIVLWDNTLNSPSFVRFAGDSGVAWTSGDIVLAAGHEFTLTVNPYGANGGTETGTVLNFAVPAPGALALLGVAGVVGVRRRRA
jgi:hypothetical protein